MDEGNSHRNNTAGKFLSWIALLIAIASAVFSSGQAYYQIQTLQKDLQQMREEFARKDVLQGQLQILEWRIQAMQDASRRTEEKLDQVLKAVK